ncbi:RagB/SusD family nutrient uptake outer membrane protein [Cyclobacterium plantarum]|uniref:RagB/SusD family nutrient uptake outer membrane protein n=1 Tax=Cyclobacterium plantarum TaxID=2716263 RepID=A0ABX0H8Y2_9BACT|nr:RagB/SusD family nutrient uptake outer membrane protein [Cyclobacterium plantarum]NHE58077.1 RagB/SusD family nutrient uptake outer membrane protein [Cyclobacterium plantarum]
MKIYNYIILCASLLAIGTSACDESSILEEVPLDFASPENSYITFSDFNAAVYALYDQSRVILSDGEHRPLDYIYGTDLGYNGANQLNVRFGSYLATLLPTSGLVEFHWRQYYRVISGANIILNRMENSAMSEQEKTLIEAQAKLFRGFAYRNLAHLYGGVPLELEEVSSPKTDYVRASREEVYLQAAEDLEFAAANLPEITAVRDGEVNNLAAYHILAEVYVSLERWTDAITAASMVIDDPNTALMTERFGSLASEPGDVYWDLFRRYNQNRGVGNTEGIWVWQYEVDIQGGVISSSSKEGPQLERDHAPRPWSFIVRDPSGVAPFLPQGVSDYTGGRGIGRFRGTNHFNYGIWHYDWEDMRNSEHNFIRDVAFNNPESEWYGQNISDHMPLFRQSLDDTIRYFYPYQSKVTTPGQHPPELYVDAELKLLNSSTAGTTYSDQYHIRLAETYLLRAEAYLGNNQPAEAATDINVVRDRANARPVSPGEVDIDFILDERMRELGVEEKRRLTLNRLGLLYERTNRYCEGRPDVTNFGVDVQPYHNLWPIPFSEIERNTGSQLAQNPGYATE